MAGVLQGDTLAPFLFTIALDYAMRIATKDIQSFGFILKPERSRRHPALIIIDADFADDLALTSETITDLYSERRISSNTIGAVHK